MSPESSPSRSPFSELRPPNPPPLFIVSRRAETGGAIRLIVAGELDLVARPHFKTALAEAQNDSNRVLLDLRALSFIDCACVGSLFAAAKRGLREGAELTVLSPRGQVRRMLELVGPLPGVTLLEQDDLPERRAPVAA
jgi:anti-sigma B factor antagonist